MQSVQSLSFEAIPSRFCESGDHQSIAATGDFTYVSGLAAAFSNASFVQRTHVNAIGRLGTTAQALMQAGGLVGYVNAFSYGEFAAVVSFDGSFVSVWISAADNNNTQPPGTDAFYKITTSADIDDSLPPESLYWSRAAPAPGSNFFDVP